MKNKWSNYALKDGKIKQSYLREHKNGDGARRASKASYCDSLQQSREKQEEVKEIELVFREPPHFKINVNPIILNDAWVINLRNQDESVREENVGETHQQRRQGIQIADKGRSETQESNQSNERKEIMKKATAKHKMHEAKESKAHEKKEDKKEAKKESKKK